MAYSLQITDRNGHSVTRELSVKTRTEAWPAYTALWDNDAIVMIELFQDGVRIARTELKLAGTPEAYRISTAGANRFTPDNTEGYDIGQLRRLNTRYATAVYLPPAALAAMSDIELKSWQDHCAERVLADFDASPQRGRL